MGQNLRAARSAVLTSTLLAALAVGCDKEEPKPAALSAAPAPSVAPLATASAAPAAPAVKTLAERLVCTKLLPEGVVTGLAIGFEVQQGKSDCPECGPRCNLFNKARPIDGASVAYTCNVPFDKAKVDAAVAPLKKELKKPQSLTEFGRGGVHGEKDNGAFYEVLAYDDDSDCSVVVDWMRGTKKDAVPLAKAALAGIKAKDLEAPSSSSPVPGHGK